MNGWLGVLQEDERVVVNIVITLSQNRSSVRRQSQGATVFKLMPYGLQVTVPISLSAYQQPSCGEARLCNRLLASSGAAHVALIQQSLSTHILASVSTMPCRLRCLCLLPASQVTDVARSATQHYSVPKVP